jgi:hypothetical protein
MFKHSISVYGIQNGDDADIELIYRVLRSVTDIGQRVCESNFSALRQGFATFPQRPTSHLKILGANVKNIFESAHLCTGVKVRFSLSTS